MGDGNNLNGKDFVIGVLIGGIIGAAAALLLAPKSGRELRNELTDSYQTVAKKTQELVKQVGQQMDEIVAKVKVVTSNVKEDVSALKVNLPVNAVEGTGEKEAVLHVTEEAAATSDSDR